MINPRQMVRALKYDFEGICDVYELLSDAYSREILVKIATSRVTKNNKHLPKTPRQQYSYVNGDVAVRAEEGDFVIDGGAYTGDTALKFCKAVGEQGRVYSFEFLPESVEQFQKNVLQNPEFEKRVALFQRALWKDSKTMLYVTARKDATKVTFYPSRHKSALKIESAAIDDLVASGAIEKIDFFKLDIEAAEVSCLMGAQEAIRRFRPKLAICVYHKFDHFVSIPKFLHQLVPEYQFYMDHHSRDLSETVLYAKCADKV